MAFDTPNTIERTRGTELYSVLFHYNHYTDKWNCFERGEKREYFNGTTKKVGIGKNVTDAFWDYKTKLDE